MLWLFLILYGADADLYGANRYGTGPDDTRFYGNAGYDDGMDVYRQQLFGDHDSYMEQLLDGHDSYIEYVLSGSDREETGSENGEQERGYGDSDGYDGRPVIIQMFYTGMYNPEYR